MPLSIAKLTNWISRPKTGDSQTESEIRTAARKTAMFRYLIGIGTVLAAAGARGLFGPALGNFQPFTFFFAAIALTSWYAGFWPSLLAIILSYFAALWFFIPPRYSFDMTKFGLDDFVSLAGFLCSGLAIAFTSQALHRARERAEIKQRELTREIAERERVQQQLEIAQARLVEHTLTLEKRVEERTANLTETIQSLEGVCYHIAHDLRAPLRAMQGFTTLLLTDCTASLDKTGKDYARRVAEAADRMDNLIHCLLDYGRIGHLQFALATLDLETHVDTALAHLASHINLQGASIRVDRPLPKILGHSALLDQVLSNLISNALKFAASDTVPCLHIRAELRGDMVRVWFVDKGIGIPAEYQGKIFQIFEQLQESQIRTGTGIGLAIVAKAVQRMRGRVGVESEPGRGSRFWVELRAAPLESGL